MRVACFLLVAVLAVPASAQAVYKCRDARGGPVFQSHPCDGAASEKEYRYEAQQPSTANQRRIAQYRRELEESNAPSSGPRWVSREISTPKRSGCQIAKDERDATLRRVGLKRNFDLLRQLDENVYRACK